MIGELTGLMVGGSEAMSGLMIGETNGGHLSLAISARASTI